MDWDDLRFVLAVAEARSLAGAARVLGVNHTTVLRRVSAFEARLGLRLFERLPTGYVPTAGGEELIAAAREISATVVELERKLAGKDLRLAGTIRVTTTDTLMASVLPGILADFREAHAGIEVEITLSNLMLDLARRDADVAIRPVRSPPESLVGRRITEVAFAVYGSRDYLNAAGAGRALAEHRWVAPDDSLAGTSVAQWMSAELPQAEIALRADTLLGLKLAAEAGLGLAGLPCYLGDPAPALVRVHGPVKAMETALWVLTHHDLRHTSRIRAFTEFVGAALARHRPLFAGEGAG